MHRQRKQWMALLAAAGWLAAGAAGEARAGWTPASMTTAMWLAADDLDGDGTVEGSGESGLVSGDVATWVDKSGNGRNATGTVRPTYTAGGLNGLSVVTFDGATNGDILKTTWYLTNAYTIVAVAKKGVQTTDTGSSLRPFIAATTTGARTLAGVGTFRTTPPAGWVSALDFFVGTSRVTAIEYSWTNTEPLLASCTHSGTTLSGWKNGNPYSSPLSNTDTGFGPVQIGGSDDNNARRFAGDIAEVIVLGGAATTNDRQKLEGYMAWKWGLQAKLPAGHPYKSAAPTDPPAVQNQPATAVTTNSATFNGTLTSTGSPPADVVYVLWGQNTNSWTYTNIWTGGGWTNNTPFSTNITGLSQNTTYYYAYAASNSTTNVVASGPIPFITGAVWLDGTATNASDHWYTPASGTVTVWRASAATNLPLVVNYTLAGTATNNADYTVPGGAGTVTIPAGAVSAPIVIQPVPDAVAEPDRTVVVTLTNGAYAIGAPSNATVTIVDGGAVVIRDFYVAKTGNDASSGVSWATAKLTIQAGINLATNNGDTVHVSNGVYTLTTDYLRISNGITLRGENGWSNTVIAADGNRRCLYVTGAGAVIEGFSITNGYANDLASHGGGIRFENNGSVCTARQCAILYNRSGDEGAAVWVGPGGKAALENCVIAGNYAQNKDVVCADGAGAVLTVQNCTIARNSAANGGPGIVTENNGSILVRNSIVWNNAWFSGVNNYGGSSLTFSNSCTYPMPGAGSGNTTNDPQFMYDGDGYGTGYGNNANFRLRPSSPCVDTALAALAPATDIEGTARNTDGNGDTVSGCDMGAYEAPAYGAGPLRFGLLQDRAGGIASFPVAFAATNVTGAQTNGLTYAWSFGDGQSTNGAGLTAVTNLYATPGTYRARLIVSNSVNEAATNDSLAILVAPPVAYVAKGGSNIAPYDTWAKAASTVQSAINVSYADATTSTVVLVSNGTYKLASATQIKIDRGITLRSVNGCTNTIIAGPGDQRCFYVIGSGSGAVVDGFSITNGNANQTTGPGGNFGGGFRADASCTFRNCSFMYNQTTDKGGAMSINGGNVLVENCVVAGNLGGNFAAISVQGSPVATFQNCTITGNKGTSGVGGIYQGGGTVIVRNSIVYNNMGQTVIDNYSGTIAFTNSCTSPLPAGGSGNTNANPQFVYAGDGYGLTHSNGNYHIGSASPCTDTGIAVGAPTNDIERNLRPQDGDGNGSALYDMGAYEAPNPLGGALGFSLVQATSAGLAPLAVGFRITAVSGTNTNGLFAQWTFGDGNTTNGANLLAVTNTYTVPGNYQCRAVLNNDGGESVTNTTPVFLVSPATNYVAIGGSHTFPYDTWGKAANNLQAAIDAGYGDGINYTVVLVSNGTYTISSPILLGKGLAVRSANGPTGTIVNANGTRAFYVTGAGAVLEGMTITNGNAPASVFPYNIGGGMAANASCTVRGCIFVRNYAADHGGAASVNGGTVRFQNCLVAGNESGNAGGGLTCEGGTMILENCTVVGNYARTNGLLVGVGGGIYGFAQITALNSIIYSNSGNATYPNYNGLIAFTNSCTSPLPAGGTNNIATNPLFVAPGSGFGLSHVLGDYRLSAGSPALNAGNNLYVNTPLDLDGQERINGGSVDMGAYEKQWPRGTAFIFR